MDRKLQSFCGIISFYHYMNPIRNWNFTSSEINNNISGDSTYCYYMNPIRNWNTAAMANGCPQSPLVSLHEPYKELKPCQSPSLMKRVIIKLYYMNPIRNWNVVTPPLGSITVFPLHEPYKELKHLFLGVGRHPKIWLHEPYKELGVLQNPNDQVRCSTPAQLARF